ncbi:MAG: hypothetical protein M3220_01015 [Chloroflexota bacterium]|nr:hypothetical protein [Chloroflexota bacterium]
MAVVLWALHPLWEARQARQRLERGAVGNETLENLLFERERLLVSLRDLRFDHAMGKLNDEDFATLDAQYRERAISVLQQLDTLGATEPETDEESLDTWIERAVAEVRARTPQTTPPNVQPFNVQRANEP